jgi:DNA-binding NarL/FixJ family response regulator
VAGEADSIATALDLVERLAPSAILLDVHLPDGDCFKLAAKLRASHPGLAILLTSAEFQISFYARAETCGARGFVPKNQLGHVDLARFWPAIGPEEWPEPASSQSDTG